MGTEIKWMSLENADATRDLAEHGYVKRIIDNGYREPYEGNAQLCNKNAFCSDDGEGPMLFDKIESFNTEPHKYACKKCLKIYAKMEAK